MQTSNVYCYRARFRRLVNSRNKEEIMQKLFTLNRKVVQTGAIAAMLVLVFALAIGPAGAQDNDGSPGRTISVSGTGEVFGQPDIAYINLGVDQADADVSTAIESANSTLASIVAALTDAGVDANDIQTNNFNVYPEDRYDPRSGQPTGERIYHVMLSVSATVRDITKVGEVIQAGLNAGANSVNGLSFGIADVKALEAEARKQAVADARDRAGQLADAFGVSVGAPVAISETQSGGVVFPQFDRAMGGGGFGAVASAAPEINPGQLSVSVTVDVTFGIE